MEREQQQIKPLLQRSTRLTFNFTYKRFVKKGYRVTPKLILDFDARERFRETQKTMKVLRVSKKMKMVKKLELAEFAIPPSKAIYIAKKMASTSCLKVYGKVLVKLCSKYMKHLESLSSSVMTQQGRMIGYGYERSSQRQNRQLAKKTAVLSGYLKYLPRLVVKTKEINFPSPTERVLNLDYHWRFEQYPESIRKIWFNGTRYLEKPLDISMAHLKNLKDLKFEFGREYQNSVETMKSVAELLPQVPQLEILHVDFVANFQIDASICKAVKSFTSLKKARFSISWIERTLNREFLKYLEDCPLEDLDFRVTIQVNMDVLSGISEFLSKKKDLKTLKLKIINRYAFTNLKPIEDLLQAVDSLPQLTSFSILTMVDPGPGRYGYTYNPKGLPEIDLSFDQLFSRSVPLKKFRISLHQHKFSQDSFMKLLQSLKKFSPTLEKVRIDAGEIRLKDMTDTDSILDFIKSLQNIRSLKLYSLSVLQEAFFSELSEAIQGLRFLRVFCLGEISAKVKRFVFLRKLWRILSKFGLERFECEADGVLRNSPGRVLDLMKIQKKNPYLKSWPNYRLYFNEPL